MAKKMDRKVIAGCMAIAIAAVTIFSGCVEEEQLSAADITEMVLANADKIHTYSFDMNMTTKMLITNETGQTDLTTISQGNGVVDNINKKMAIFMDMSMKIAEMPEVPGRMEMEMYLVNNTIYSKVDMGIATLPAQWVKMQMPEGYDDYWSSQNQLQQQMELLNASEVTRLEDDMVNGVDCYVLEIDPDLEKFWELVSDQSGMVEQLQALPGFDIQKMMKSLAMKEWIAKDTNFPAKTEMAMSMAMSSEDLNIPYTEEKFTMTMDYDIEMIFFDYNNPVTIELPEEAKNATTIPMPMFNQTPSNPPS
jgi:hypothetical protein